MITPGLFECTFGELQPVLQQLLKDQMDAGDQVLFCCMKFWDGELSAFVLTDRKALLCGWDTCADLKQDAQFTAAVDFKDITSIRECSRVTDMLTREHQVELWGAMGLPAPLARFAFLRRDRLYERFCFLVQERMGARQRIG